MPLLFRSYIPTAIFWSPPQDSTSSYRAFISPTTSNLISAYTIPAIEAALHELLVLGMEFYRNNSNMRHDTYKPGSQAMFLASLIQKMACQPPLWQMCLQTQCVYTYIKADSTHILSILLDMKRFQPIEVEAILGEVQWVSPSLIICHIDRFGFFWLVVQNQVLDKIETAKC